MLQPFKKTVGNQFVSQLIRMKIPLRDLNRLLIVPAITSGQIHDRKTGFRRETSIRRIAVPFQGWHQDENWLNMVLSTRAYYSTVRPPQHFIAKRQVYLAAPVPASFDPHPRLQQFEQKRVCHVDSLSPGYGDAHHRARRIAIMADKKQGVGLERIS